MSKRPEPGWSLWCDFPGCDYQWEYGDYTIFGAGWDADEIVSDSDGWRGIDGTSHYCHRHVTAWASDHEDGSPFPAPPYLLIHDGDTGDVAHDGLVSLVTAAAAPATDGGEHVGDELMRRALSTWGQDGAS